MFHEACVVKHSGRIVLVKLAANFRRKALLGKPQGIRANGRYRLGILR